MSGLADSHIYAAIASCVANLLGSVCTHGHWMTEAGLTLYGMKPGLRVAPRAASAAISNAVFRLIAGCATAAVLRAVRRKITLHIATAAASATHRDGKARETLNELTCEAEVFCAKRVQLLCHDHIPSQEELQHTLHVPCTLLFEPGRHPS